MGAHSQVLHLDSWGRKQSLPANRITLRDVLFDFFGSLIPGIIFAEWQLWPWFGRRFLFVEVTVKALWPSQNEKPGTESSCRVR